MPETSFSQQLTAAARVVARIEIRLRTARARLSALEDQLRESKRQLRLLVQAMEPYTPPSTEAISQAADAAAER